MCPRPLPQRTRRSQLRAELRDNVSERSRLLVDGLTEREQGDTGVGSDTGDDELLLVKCNDGVAELLLVPSKSEPVPIMRDRIHTLLSQALTSPLRLMYGALGWSARISGGTGPFGPVSALVVMMVGKSK